MLALALRSPARYRRRGRRRRDHIGGRYRHGVGFGTAPAIRLAVPPGEMGPSMDRYVRYTLPPGEGAGAAAVMTDGAPPPSHFTLTHACGRCTGHCLSDETSHKPLPGTSYLYPSNGPYCAHAYAVSKKSAAHLVRLLRTPLFAYSRPIGD